MKLLILATLLTLSTSATALSINTPVFDLSCPWVVTNSQPVYGNPSMMNSFIEAVRRWFINPSVMN